MSSYQLLFLNSNYDVQLAQSLFSEDDTHAIATASEMTAGRVAELWTGDRLVKTFLPRAVGAK